MKNIFKFNIVRAIIAVILLAILSIFQNVKEIKPLIFIVSCYIIIIFIVGCYTSIKKLWSSK